MGPGLRNMSPQGLKPYSYCGTIGTTEEAAEKVRTKSEFDKGQIGRG